MSRVQRGTILLGDAWAQLRRMPEEFVDCVVTSPPYFRLRDYQVPGQLGLESHVDAWVADLRAVARQVRRVLVASGTFWLNLGDTYSTHPREGAPRKSLLLAPERLSLALSADGWLVRNKIVWAKANTLPSPVRDRLSTRHELVLLLTRSPSYYFDLDAVRLPHRSRPPARTDTSRPRRGGNAARPSWLGPNADTDTGLARLRREGRVGHVLGKNPGDVWDLAASRYRGAHFATYPEALVERILRAGCPERRCTACRRPWRPRPRELGEVAVHATGCDCDDAGEPGLVLDPFMGSATTAVVAERLGRDWVGIELNPHFIRLAHERLTEARRIRRP